MMPKGYPLIEQSYSCKQCGKTFNGQHSHTRLANHIVTQHIRKGKTYKELYGEEKAMEYQRKLEDNQAHTPPESKLRQGWAKGTKLSTERRQAIAGDILKHDEAILEEIASFEKQGYRCIPTGLIKLPTPDFIAITSDKVFAVEVEFGRLQLDRYADVTCYNDIIWIKRTRKGR